MSAIRRLGVDRPLIQALHKVDDLQLLHGACGLTSERERALRQLRMGTGAHGRTERMSLLVGLAVVGALMLLAVIGAGDWQSYWFCPDDPLMLVSRLKD